MTSKYYSRSLVLHNFGIQAEPKVLELYDYITERLSNLNQYTSVKYPDFIFYGKSNDQLIIDYNLKKEYINLYYDAFTSKLFKHFNLQHNDIDELNILKYVIDTLQINSNNIYCIYMWRSSDVVDTLQINSNYIGKSSMLLDYNVVDTL